MSERIPWMLHSTHDHTEHKIAGAGTGRVSIVCAISIQKKALANELAFVLIVLSNPEDILTYMAWKMQGFPKHCIFDSASIWTSARLISHGRKTRYQLSEWLTGDHGDSSVPVWCQGVFLKLLHHDRGGDIVKEHWKEIHKQVHTVRLSN
uniref:L-lactate dehydrogenase n=1 Tax=Pelusios castaneus TaxID=367368 RepID=A0A8C8RDK5_9SAUR